VEPAYVHYTEPYKPLQNGVWYRSALNLKRKKCVTPSGLSLLTSQPLRPSHPMPTALP
jgi:hypothetical protein